MVSARSSRLGCRMIQRAVKRGKVSGLMSRRFAPRGGERALRLRSPFWFQQGGQCGITPLASPSRHLRSCLAPSASPLPPAPVTDSTFSARSIRCRTSFADYAGCSRSFRRSQTAETVKIHRARPRNKIKKWSRGFARPRRAIARELRTGKTSAIVAATVSFRGTPQAAFAKQADAAGKANQSDTPAAGCGQVG